MPPLKKQLVPRHGTASLALRINGRAYRVRPLAADGEVAYKAFSLSSGSKVYHVAMTPEGHECDCPDSEFHRRQLDPRGCKHVLACRAVGLIDDV